MPYFCANRTNNSCYVNTYLQNRQLQITIDIWCHVGALKMTDVKLQDVWNQVSNGRRLRRLNALSRFSIYTVCSQKDFSCCDQLYLVASNEVTLVIASQAFPVIVFLSSVNIRIFCPAISCPRPGRVVRQFHALQLLTVRHFQSRRHVLYCRVSATPLMASLYVGCFTNINSDVNKARPLKAKAKD